MVSQSVIHSTGHPLSPHPPDQQWRPAGNATVDTREVGPDTRECTFNVLTPGRGYTITVATISGNLSSSIAVEGRTGESRTWQPPYLHQHLLTLHLPLCVCVHVSAHGSEQPHPQELWGVQPAGVLGQTRRRRGLLQIDATAEQVGHLKTARVSGQRLFLGFLTAVPSMATGGQK